MRLEKGQAFFLIISSHLSLKDLQIQVHLIVQSGAENLEVVDTMKNHPFLDLVEHLIFISIY